MELFSELGLAKWSFPPLDRPVGNNDSLITPSLQCSGLWWIVKLPSRPRLQSEGVCWHARCRSYRLSFHSYLPVAAVALSPLSSSTVATLSTPRLGKGRPNHRGASSLFSEGLKIIETQYLHWFYWRKFEEIHRFFLRKDRCFVLQCHRMKKILLMILPMLRTPFTLASLATQDDVVWLLPSPFTQVAWIFSGSPGLPCFCGLCWREEPETWNSWEPDG